MSVVDGEVSLTDDAINDRLNEMLNNLKELYKFNKIEDQSEGIKVQLTEIGNALINIINNYKGTNIENIKKKYIKIRTEIENNHMPKYELNVYRTSTANIYYKDKCFQRFLYYPFMLFQDSEIKIELEKLEKKMNKGGKRKSRRNQKSKKSRKTRRRRRR